MLRSLQISSMFEFIAKMYLLFDLDGTLTDSREGIIRCIVHALAEIGILAPPIEALTQYVGPPLFESFAALLVTANTTDIEIAIAAYRRRFEKVGMFENVLYPCIRETLEILESFGHALYVVTAKPQKYAEQILDHFKLRKLFRGVYGPELGERQYSKESLIRQACTSRNLIRGHTMMIGDRAEDILGAKLNGLFSVGVTWGYGKRNELDIARPDRLVNSCEELVDYIQTVSNAQ